MSEKAVSEKAGDFSPESTYFSEREERITAEIATAQAKVDVCKREFEMLSRDLTERREALIASTAALHAERAQLQGRIKMGRESIQAMAELVDECEALSASLADLLAPADLNLAQLSTEIAGLEAQRDKKSAKPKHEVEGLEARLVRLRLRRTLAMKKLQYEAAT